jgi:hypothetical protein
VSLAERRDRVRGAIKPPEYSFGPLLLVILASLVFQLAAPEADWARVVTIGLQGATLLLALSVSGTRRELVHLARLLVAVAILGTAGVLAGTGELGPVAAKLVSLALVALAPIAIAFGLYRHVREQHAVTVPTMFGVLCIYLLIGMLFSFVFAAIDHIGSTPFFTAPGSQSQSDFLYFSFTTITTTGYGDLVAATSLGRSMAIMEALTGQIYLVTVVALIVGNLRPRRRAGDASEDG